MYKIGHFKKEGALRQDQGLAEILKEY